VLGELADFEPYSAFNLLKRNDFESSLNSKQLHLFLKMTSESLHIEEEEICHLFHYLGCKHIGHMLYSEFLQLVLPNKRKKLRERILKRKQKNERQAVNPVASQQVLFAIAQVFEQEVVLHRQLSLNARGIHEESWQLLLDPLLTGKVGKKSLMKAGKLNLGEANSIFRRLQHEEKKFVPTFAFRDCLCPKPAPRDEVEEALRRSQHSSKEQTNYKSLRSKAQCSKQNLDSGTHTPD